jgi:hypothetical protein
MHLESTYIIFKLKLDTNFIIGSTSFRAAKRKNVGIMLSETTLTIL